MPRILTPADIADFRNRLCDVAAQLFAELGSAGFNMRELARRLGVSAMTPYRYFQDKDAILAEVRARAFGRFADRLEEALSVPAADEGTFAQAYAQFAIQEQIQYRLMFDLAQPQAPTPPAFAAQEQRARAAIVTHAKAQMTRPGADPELSGIILWSTLHGITSLYLTGKLSSEDFHRALSRATGLGPTDALTQIREFGGSETWWTAPSSFPQLSFQPVAAAGE